MRASLGIFLSAIFVTSGRAQTTYPAASCNESDVAAAISRGQASPADGDVISIPAGTCTWTGTTGIIQTFTNSVTIQGAGAVSSAAGGSGTTGTDQTIIIDNITYSGGPLSMMAFTVNSPKSFRFTGISIQENGSSTVPDLGFVELSGTSSAVRLDHNHFVFTKSGMVGFVIGGSLTGVADHDYAVATSSVISEFLSFRNGVGWNGVSSDLYADSSWTDTDHWGTSKFFFLEDSLFQYGSPCDSGSGARFVLRYCTMTGSPTVPAVQFFNHGLTNSRWRSTRAAEAYQNNFTESSQSSGQAGPDNGGAMLFWGNTITNFGAAVGLALMRNEYTESAPPAGWGDCGSASGGPTNWDGNLNTTGYPCLDGAGRGVGDLLANYFSSVIDSTTSSVTWPHQVLDPVYIWDNTLNSTASVVSSISMYTDNQDYYQQFGAGGEPGTFNGTKGIGQGPYSSIPSTCTAGVDPKTSASAPGVGYWATDQNTLYVCNPTNTWTPYYTPYTYPHPLTANSNTTPAPPTNVQAVSH